MTFQSPARQDQGWGEKVTIKQSKGLRSTRRTSEVMQSTQAEAVT